MPIVIRTVVLGYLGTMVVALAAGAVATAIMETARRRSPAFRMLSLADDAALQRFWVAAGLGAPV